MEKENEKGSGIVRKKRTIWRSAGWTVAAVLLLVNVWAESPEEKEQQPRGYIALTFDDGPHSKYTAEILDLLKEYHVHATFFVVGSNVRTYPDLVIREISEGHEVGNHTDTHPCAVNKLDKTSLIKELTDAENAIYEVSDYRPHLFRPPGGLRSNLITELADEMDYSIVLWSIDTLDWSKNTDVNYVLKTVRKNIKDGAIILCHDYVVRNKSVTVEALKILIPELISQGYEFVLASELIAESK